MRRPAVCRQSLSGSFAVVCACRRTTEGCPVGRVESSGPRLVAFFALMYFAALRPEEAVSFREIDAVLPADGWGEIHLSRSTPDVGRDWTDNGAARDVRQLKHRGRGEVRIAPCPPELTAILRAHIDRTASRPTVVSSEAFGAGSSPGRRTTARGSGPGKPLSRLPSPHQRSRAPRTPCGTPASPRGSTAAWRPLRWPSGPGIRSTSCSGSMRSAGRPGRRGPEAGTGRARRAAHLTLVRGHGTGTVTGTIRARIAATARPRPDSVGHNKIGPSPVSAGEGPI
jgi:hypothetical protein